MVFGGKAMIFNPFIWANKSGIPRLEATDVTVGTSSVVFNFKNHSFLNAQFAGLIIFKLPAYTAPDTAVPIIFNTNGKSVNLTTLGGENVTSSQVNLAGVYVAFYDGTSLQLLTGI